MITLYDLPASGNSYRARLMLALAQTVYRRVVIEHEALAGHKELRLLNGLGEVPVLVDGSLVLRDSQAILVYLARRYAPEWLPDCAVDLAAIQQWLSFSANEIQNGPRYARAISLGLIEGDCERYMLATVRVLAYLEQHLSARQWLHGSRPTIADVACHPYICNIGDAGINIKEYPNVEKWLRGLTAQPGYLAFDAKL